MRSDALRNCSPMTLPNSLIDAAIVLLVGTAAEHTEWSLTFQHTERGPSYSVADCQQDFSGHSSEYSACFQLHKGTNNIQHLILTTNYIQANIKSPEHESVGEKINFKDIQSYSTLFVPYFSYEAEICAKWALSRRQSDSLANSC